MSNRFIPMPEFNGFNPDAIQFLVDIKHNNNRDWFESRRDFYDHEVLEKSRDFVEAMGEKLLTIAPRVHVVPKVNGSIYRFSRDARFSKDKTPYKTHFSYLFWEGNIKRTRCPGFFLGITAEDVRIGAGINIFEPSYLAAWRECCVDKRLGPELEKITQKLDKAGFHRNGEQLRRMPHGFSKEHPNQEMIRYKGFRFIHQHPLPNTTFNAGFVDHCMEYFQQLSDFHQWTVKVLSHMRPGD